MSTMYSLILVFNRSRAILVKKDFHSLVVNIYLIDIKYLQYCTIIIIDILNK